MTKHFYEAVWVVLGVAYFVAAGTYLVITLDDLAPDHWAFFLFLVCMLVLMEGLLIHARRDPYAAAACAAALAFPTAIITGAVANYSTPPSSVAKPVTAILAVVFVTMVFCLFRFQYSKRGLPNLLEQLFPQAPIGEVDGVCFVVSWPSERVFAGEIVWAKIVAQNCWNAPRTLSVALSVEKASTSERERLLFDRVAPLELPAGATASLEVPIAAGPDARGFHRLVLAFEAIGHKGTRIRPARGRIIERPLDDAELVALALVGFFANQGGVRLNLKVDPRRNGGLWPIMLPDRSRRVIWIPTRRQMEGALKIVL